LKALVLAVNARFQNDRQCHLPNFVEAPLPERFLLLINCVDDSAAAAEPKICRRSC
jgi:hypothetical protein